MSGSKLLEFPALYAGFDAPITAFNCGDKCAPYNENGVPFCCDHRHAVPTAYQAEWEYLQANTDLWHEWESNDPVETAALRKQTPDGQVLIGCRGAAACQRGFRSVTCRAFPFFPYFNTNGEFIGLSYYAEYEDRCWVISNLQLVSPTYRAEFIRAYDALFEQMPEERDNFSYHSKLTRRLFARQGRSVPLLHRNGGSYKISPRTGRMRRVSTDSLPKFGPYKIAAELPFPDEL